MLFGLRRAGALPTITSLGTTGNNYFVGGTTVLVNGTGFISGSVCYADGAALTTTFVNSTQVSVAFPNTLHWPKNDGLATLAIQVSNASGKSLPTNYTLAYPSNILAHYRPDLGVTFGIATAVAQWNDNVGGDSNKHAVQATGANQPLYVASESTYNNRPVMRFDAFTWLRTGTWSTAMTHPNVIYIVGHGGSYAANHFFLDGLTGSNRRAVRQANTDGEYLLAGSTLLSTAKFLNNTSTKQFLCSVFNTTSSKVYLNSKTTSSTAGDSGSSTCAGLVIGAANDNSLTQAGKTGEIIITNDSAINADIADYLASKYAITLV